MYFDEKVVERLDKKEKDKILTKKSFIWIGGFFVFLGLLGDHSGDFIFGLLLIFYGFRNRLLQGERRKDYLTSILLNR